MSIFEYDAQKHLAQEKEESKEEGKLEGRLEGRLEKELSVICKLLSSMSALEVANLIDIEETYVKNIQSLIKEHPEKSDEELVKFFINI